MNSNILLVAFALVAQIPTFAQTNDRIFKPFRMEAAMGYVNTAITENKYALDFSLEPKYGINDAVWIGLRLEAALLIKPTTYTDDFQSLGIFSVLSTVDYSFVINENFRPYVGFGTGTYTFKHYYDGEDARLSKTATQFGFCPRVGFEFKRMRVGVEFNMIQGGYNYTAFKVGFPLGSATRD